MQIWKILICLTSLCQLILCEFAPTSGGCFFFDWSINATSMTAWRLFCKIHGNNISLLTFSYELALEILGKYGRNRPAQSLNTSGIAGTSINLDSLNHVVVKGE